jgi:uncharacterized membrane protein YbhN (UPF0104 family)
VTLTEDLVRRAGAPPGAASRDGRRSNRLGWILAGLILLGCILFVDLDDVARTLGRLTPVELALLLLISTADRLLMGYKWALLLRIAGVAIPTRRVIRYFYQASFAGSFLPSHVGGDILRAWWVMRDSGVAHPVFASLLVERMLGFAAAVNWAILGGTVFLCHLEPDRTPGWIALGLLAAAVANAAFALLLSAPAHRFVLRLLANRQGSRVLGKAYDFCEAFARFGARPRQLALNALLTVVEQGLQMLLYLGIAWSIDAVPAVVPFLAATALFTLVIRLPIAPDGWGVGELAAIGAYGLVGVSAAEAFSVSAIGHLVPMVALAPGLVLLLASSRAPAKQPVTSS